MSPKQKDTLIKLIIVGAGFLVLFLTLFPAVNSFEIPDEPQRPENRIK